MQIVMRKKDRVLEKESTHSAGRLEDFPEEVTSGSYRMNASCQTGKQGHRWG